MFSAASTASAFPNPDKTFLRVLSGAGKTSLSRALLQQDPGTVLSISTTTRPKRPGEEDGKDYNFVDKKTFDKMIEGDEFLEYATVFDYSYGTPKKPVLDALDDGKDVLFDIDWQGTQQLAQKKHDDLVRIFVLPPSMDALHDRLMSRAQDTEQEVQSRMSKAVGEISHWAEYDYVLLNREFDVCLEEIKTILKAERMRRTRQVGLEDFVNSLTRDSG